MATGVKRKKKERKDRQGDLLDLRFGGTKGMRWFVLEEGQDLLRVGLCSPD
jgi:hypothetical protein